jgi:peptide/nickel transport system substrate-binding protein
MGAYDAFSGTGSDAISGGAEMMHSQQESGAARVAAGVTRRRLLSGVISGAGLALLAACQPTPAAPTVAPARPQPTSAPPAVAAKPTAAPQPAAPATPVPAAATVVTAAPPAAQPRGGGTLRFGILTDIPSLDARIVSSTAYEGLWTVYDRLTWYNDKLEAQPQLAESWEFSSDLRQIKLNLRKGVTFHTGREFTSEDVEWNLLRARDPKSASAAFRIQSNWFTEMTLPDKNTIVLKSEQPRPAAFNMFENFNILDRETMEGPNATTRAVGTGPFSFVEWQPGSQLRLAKNPNYWRTGRPYVDALIVNIIPDPQALVAQLEGGNLDIIKSPPLRDFVRLKADPRFQTIEHSASALYFLLGANLLNPPLDNKKVRQALNYAIDRQRFTETVLLGTSTPFSLPWLPSSHAYDAQKRNFYTYDPDKAKALLNEAGVGNFEIDILPFPGYAELTTFAQLYQGDLAKLGIKLNVQSLQAPAWLDQINNRKYTGVYATAAGDAQMEPVTLFTNSRVYDPGGNNSGYKDDRYQELVNSASVEPDIARRKQLYAQLNDLVLDESFSMPMADNKPKLVTRAGVTGIVHLLHEAFSFVDTSL